MTREKGIGPWPIIVFLFLLAWLAVSARGETVTVTDDLTDEPIEGAVVTLGTEGGTLHNTTGADGICTIPVDFATGTTVGLTVTATGYTSEQGGTFLVTDDGIFVSLSRSTPAPWWVGLVVLVGVVAGLLWIRRQF